MGHLRSPAERRWKLLLSFTAALVALGKLALLFDADYSLRWRALSVSVLLAVLAASQLAAVVAAYRSKEWFASHYEHICASLEVLAVFSTFWWLTMLKPSELLPEQGPFTALVFRGYMLLCDQMRLATCIPLLMFQGCVFMWMELSRHPNPAGIAALLKYLFWGQIAPLVIMLCLELQHRWQFIRHRGLGVGTQGPWPAIIESYMLAAIAAKQQLLRLQRWASGATMLLLTVLLLGLATAIVASIFRG